MDMPFIEPTLRPFCKSDILGFNPGQIGVYGLLRDKQWIFIGKGDIRIRLLAHLNGDNEDVSREQPSHWVAEITDDYLKRELELIKEYQPLCNG
jgi:hypothetical protein